MAVNEVQNIVSNSTISSGNNVNPFLIGGNNYSPIFGNKLLGSTDVINTSGLKPADADSFSTQNPIEKQKKNFVDIALSYYDRIFPQKTAVAQLPREKDLKAAIESNPRIAEILYEANIV